jgi:hypothetical protein
MPKKLTAIRLEDFGSPLKFDTFCVGGRIATLYDVTSRVLPCWLPMDSPLYQEKATTRPQNRINSDNENMNTGAVHCNLSEN